VKTTDAEGVPVPEDVLLVKQQDRVWWTIFIMIGITAIALLLSFFIKEDLRRLTYGKDEQSALRESLITAADKATTCKESEKVSGEEDGLK